MFTMAGLLIVLAIAFRLFLPHNLTWRIPGGWPLGSVWYRPDTVAFRLLLGAGVILGLIAALRAARR